MRKWAGRPAKLSYSGVRNGSQFRALAKITFVCWGTGGLVCGVRCEGVSDGGAQIKVDVCIDKWGPSAGLFQRMWSAFSLAFRAWVLLLKFGPLFWLYPLTYLSNWFKSLWLHLLLKVTESSGPTCIKLGQWASTRRDLFSEEFCTKFSKLHIQVDPHPWDYTRCSLQKAIGEGWEKIFKFDSQQPVGSGCVAQVYKAYVDASAVEKSVLQEFTKKSALEAWQVSGLRGIFKWLWERKCEDLSGGYGCSQSHDFLKGISKHCDSGRQMSGYPSVPLSPPKRDHLVPVAIKVSKDCYAHLPRRQYWTLWDFICDQS